VANTFNNVFVGSNEKEEIKKALVENIKSHKEE
jgi:hypothetical protein